MLLVLEGIVLSLLRREMRPMLEIYLPALSACWSERKRLRELRGCSAVLAARRTVRFFLCLQPATTQACHALPARFRPVLPDQEVDRGATPVSRIAGVAPVTISRITPGRRRQRAAGRLERASRWAIFSERSAVQRPVRAGLEVAHRGRARARVPDGTIALRSSMRADRASCRKSLRIPPTALFSCWR